MPSDIMRWSEEWSAEDHRSFEALCFNRADEIEAPYTALMRAPEIEKIEVAAEIVKRAYESKKAEIERAWESWEAGKPDHIDPATGAEVFISGSEVFVLALDRLFQAPGRAPSLISARSSARLDWFECNTLHDTIDPAQNFFSGAFASGAVWDSFNFVDDAFGADTYVSFTTEHLTKAGLAFCLERYPERVEALRKLEESRKS
jgi:hypothetical protein